MKRKKNEIREVDDLDITTDLPALTPGDIDKLAGDDDLGDGTRMIDYSLQPLQERLIHVESQIAVKTQTIKSLESERGSDAEIIRGLESQLSKEQAAVRELQSTIRVALDQNKALEQQKEVMDADRESQHGAAAELQAKFAEQNKIMGSLESDLKNKSTIVTELQSTVAELKAKCAELGEFRDTVKSRDVEIAKLQEAKNTDAERIRSLESMQEELQERLRGREANLESQAEATRMHQAEISDLRKRYDEQLEASEDTGTLRTLESQLSDKQKAMATLQSDLSAALEKIAELERKRSSLESEGESHRVIASDMQIKFADQNKLIGSLEADMKNNHTVVAELQNSLAEWKQKCEELEQTKELAQRRDIEIAKLESAREADQEKMQLLQSTVKADADRITTLQSDLSDRANAFAKLENTVSTQEEDIRSLKGTIEGIEINLSEAKDALEGRDAVIRNLNADLLKKTKMLARIKSGIRHLTDYDSAHKSKPADENKIRFVDTPEDVDAHAFLVDISGQERRQYPLFKNQITLGRSFENDLQIDDIYMSGHHGEIIEKDQIFKLKDLGSKNGVYVNSTKIEEHTLKTGDIISLGGQHFEFVDHNATDAKKTVVTRIK